ncbi:1-hydroxycarotenoid 3,4-desaturase CrtD [Sphingomonas changnyeongensis]|uniref:1-hydroxycarotenoid 3,4-desaturase CrtD n=1 Tax=Sphingomonas changnyeongensis TaxID=2698679 RepID=UPI001E5182E1|nr:1-hydroxycarotenoid 3,4-desaturase CrtD [Sphingomonas changnyeongensis]
MAAGHQADDQGVVVVGAGIGGLVAATLLAARGVPVTLIERQAAPGGKARMVEVPGTGGPVAVDGGPTVFTLRDVFDEVFAEAGAALDDEVAITKADILARHGWSDGSRLDLHADPEASAAAIADFAGPREADGFRAFMAQARHSFATLEHSFIRAPRTNPIGLTWRIGMMRLGALAAIHPYTPLARMLGGTFRDPRLVQLFARYATYCGSSPYRAPATLALIAHVEQAGVWLIEGGIHALALALARLAARHGAVIRTGATVTEIETGGGRVTGVRLQSGERIAARAVIAGADVAALAAGRFGSGVARAVSAPAPQRRSLSAFTFLMQAEPGGLPLVRHNVLFSDDYRAEFSDIANGRPPQDPTVYVCALDRAAADETSAPGGPERFQIIVNAPANGDRHDYGQEEIETCTRQMQARLRACGLTLSPTRPPVVVTPTDFEHLYPSTGGALYGRASHGWAASFLRPGSRTRIPGLYCAGGSVHPGAGVPMAALSGRLAATTVLADLASTGRSRPAAMPGGMSTPSRTEAISG